MNPLELAAAKSSWAQVSVGEKAILFLGTTLCTIVLPPLPALLLFALLVIVCAVWVQVPWRLYLTLVAAPATFLALGLGPLVFAITTDGFVFIAGGPANAATVFARSVVAMSSTMLFAVTTPMAQLLPWCSRIGVPLAIVHVMSLTYRMIALLMTSARTMWNAQAARLGHTTQRRWIRSVSGLIAALFVVAFTRARRLSEGVSLRGELDTMQQVSTAQGLPMRWPRLIGYLLLLIAIVVVSLYAPLPAVMKS